MSRGDATAGTGPGPFDATTLVTVSNTGTGANANTTFDLHIETGDYNFSAVINSTPAAATIAPGPNCPAVAACNGGFIGGVHPAIGDVIGSLTSTSTLGLTNAPCGGQVFPSFTFLNATVNTLDVIDPVPQASTNVGSGGTQDNQWSDNGASTTGPGAQAPWNSAWPGMDPGESTNGLPAQVDEYPSYLNILFDPDYPLTPGTNAVQPLARYAGAANVVGTSVTLNLVIFAPDVLANAFAPPHPFADLKGLGYTSIAVLNNPAAEAALSSITDFCAELISNASINGMARVNPCNGVIIAPCNTPTGISNPAPGANTLARYANPGAAGTYLWVNFHQSLRDADGDGKENALDTCPYTVDTLNQNTGVGGNDTDNAGLGDGIAGPGAAVPAPGECDLVASGTDQDGDGWLNRGDNCPQAANATQVETELTTAYNVAAPRGGSRTDSIGDACDTAPAVANGRFETTISVEANCIGGVDGDGDGWCAGGGPGIPADPNDADGAGVGCCPEDYDLVFPMAVAHSGSGATPPMRQPVQVCNDGIDNDGDGMIDNLDEGVGVNTCRPKGVAGTPDTDGDGWGDEAERHVGTDALGRCEVGSTVPPSSDWPADVAASGGSADRITLADLGSFVAPAPKKLDTSPGDAGFNARWDLVPGVAGTGVNWIVLSDLASLVAGPTSNPPMFGGAVKIFGGPVCTAHPTFGD